MLLAFFLPQLCSPWFELAHAENLWFHPHTRLSCGLLQKHVAEFVGQNVDCQQLTQNAHLFFFVDFAQVALPPTEAPPLLLHSFV